MQFNDKNNNYSSKNLPFKSSTCFIVPFCMENETKINYFNKEFKLYDINSRVFYMNPDLKKHLTKSNDTILNVFEKNSVEKNNQNTFYFYYNDGKILRTNESKNSNFVEFFFNTERLYIFNDSVNFAFFELIVPAGTNLENLLSLNKFLKNNANIFIDRINDYVGEKINVLSEEPFLFNYTYCDTNEYNRDNLYYLASGNDPSYKTDIKTSFKEYVQSQNIMQGVVRNGISRIVNENNNEDEFHYNINNPRGMYNSVINNYVFVYVIALHQYFGLRVMNYKILETVNKDNKSKFNKKKKEYKKFLKIKSQAELFYLQNVIVDISPILHINRTYNYIRDVFHLNEIIDDFYRDLELCKSILDERNTSRVEKLNKSAKFALFIIIVTLILTLLQTIFSYLAL